MFLHLQKYKFSSPVIKNGISMANIHIYCIKFMLKNCTVYIIILKLVTI